MFIVKNFIVLLLMTSILWACGPLPQFNAAVKRQMDVEQQAIASMNIRIRAQCKYGHGIPPRNEAISNLECQERIFNESYFPASSAPDLAMNFAAQYRSATVDYAEGRISEEKLKAEYALIENEYWQKLNQRYITAQQHVIQQQQIYAAQMNALGQTLQNQSMHGEQYNQCSSISIAPIASPGCSNMCINGQWAEVC